MTLFSALEANKWGTILRSSTAKGIVATSSPGGSPCAAKIHRDRGVVHPTGRICRIILLLSLRGSLGLSLLLEEWSILLLITPERSESRGLSSSSSLSRSAFSENIVNQHPRAGTVDSALFDIGICEGHWWFQYVDHDGGGQPFDEVVGSGFIALRISGSTSEFFERGDVLVNFRKFHAMAFYLCVGAIPALGVLELDPEFMKELFPQERDIIDGRV